MTQLGHKSILKTSILVLLLLGFSASAGTAFFHVSRWLENSIQTQHITYARMAKSAFEQWLTTNSKVLTSFAGAIAKAQTSVEKNDNFTFLIDQYTQSERFDYLSFTLEESGYFQINGWVPPQGYDPRIRPWYLATKNSEQLVNYQFFNTIDENIPFLSISTAIRQQDKFLGVVSGEISIPRLGKLLLNSADKDAFIFALLDANNDVVFQTSEHINGYPVALNKLLEPVIDQVKFNHQYALADELLATYLPIPTLNMGLVVIGANSNASGSLLEESASLLAHFLVIFIIVMLAFFLSSRHILMPIMDLLELDSQTALPNKIKFKSLMETTYVDCNIPGTLVIINLDSFNQLTAAYSQAIITRLITMVKGRIQKVLPSTALLGVFSESRFVAFVPSDTKYRLKSEAVLSEIKNLLEKPFVLPTQQINLSVTLGAADYPQHGKDIEELINNAFSAYSQAKLGGGSRYKLFSDELKQKMGTQQLIVSALKNAIRLNEPYMVYQPQYDANSLQIVGMEALIRWQSSELQRQVSPAEFIDIVEQSDLVVKLGNYVIDQVCKQIKQWQAQEVALPLVAINISARHLLHKSFVHDLFISLTHYQISPAQIELELTETSFITNPQQAIAVMHELKSLGVKLAIDDFGCGYSSFQYLKSMPLDKLKIDRSFVNELSTNGDDKIIIQSIASIAENMNITLLVEGVETLEQLAILKAQAIDQIQGFLFSKPVDAEHMASLILNQDE